MSTQQQILAVFKPDLRMTPAEIARASGVDRGKLTYHLGQLVAEQKLDAAGATSTRTYALHVEQAPGAPKTNGAKPPKHTRSKAPRRHRQNGKTRAPAKQPDPPAPVCNVADFTPALTADPRLVIVGGTEPLIFSPEQTQNIATLMLDRFEA